MLKVELVYIPLNRPAFHITLNLKQGVTLLEAINLSGIYEQYSDAQHLPVGIYGKLVPLDTFLKDGDRVEFYRPLTLDPKEKRRRLARAKKI